MNAIVKSGFPTSQCHCDSCVSMCETRPCWPTPDEARAIQAAGFGARLMRDYWCADAEFPNDVDILAPAVVGYEGARAPYFPRGSCTFLKDGRCELHPLGLKPLEGRVAIHGMSDELSNSVRTHIVRLWNAERK
jgi:hypothetical protein